MKEPKLTEGLMTNRAIVVKGDDVPPADYMVVAGVGTRGPDLDLYIALPMSLKSDPKLFNRLAREAQGCLLDCSPLWFGGRS